MIIFFPTFCELHRIFLEIWDFGKWMNYILQANQPPVFLDQYCSDGISKF